MSGSVKSGEEQTNRSGSREELATPPEVIEYGTETTYTSTFNHDSFTITSPIQFENADGVKFDVKDVVVDEFELISNFEEFLVSLTIFVFAAVRYIGDILIVIMLLHKRDFYVAGIRY